MLVYIILAGLSAIAVLSVARPSWFAKIKETMAGAYFVGSAGFVTALYEYFSSDPTWQDLVPPEQLPYLLVGLGLFGVYLRTVNIEREEEE